VEVNPFGPFQLYVAPPEEEEVRLSVCPEQSDELLPIEVMVGVVLTLIVDVLISVHVNVFPVTVYVVLVVGLTVMLLVVCAVFHQE